MSFLNQWSSLAVVVVLFAGCLSGSPLAAQETSSRRANEMIKAIEQAGGRVYRISAADTSREINFALSSKPVGDEQLKNVGEIGEVIWLNLANTKISDNGLKFIGKMPLKKLHLEKTDIGDAGLKHLKGLKELEYLNLYGTQVSDAGLEALKEMKSLKKLYVWKTKVTEAGIKKLNESLPDLKIVGELKLTPVVVEKEEPKKSEPKKDAPKGEKAEANKAEGKKKNKKKSGNKKADKKTDGKSGEKGSDKS